MESTDAKQPVNIEIIVGQSMLKYFTPVFGKGVEMAMRPGCSIRDVLCRQMGVDDDYLDRRVQTVFLDGKAVDDVDTAMVRDGATLALSAAMPGLAGATMRKGGFYAAMRKEISHETNGAATDSRDGAMTLKLFNVVLKELGQLFLTHGILIQGQDMENLFETAPEYFRENCLSIKIDGRPIHDSQLSAADWRNKQIHLKILHM